MNTPRIPSPESIRQSMDDLRGGKLSPVDHETREQVLNLAQMRVEAALPAEIREQLAQYPPQLLEAYGLLLRWQAERDQYPPPREEGETQSEELALPTAPMPQPISNQPAVSQPVITQQRGSIQVHVPPGQDPLTALYQATAGPLAALHQLSQANSPTPRTFQAGPLMALDAFQGAYKGEVTITEGKGKRARSTTETIAVLKDVYEAEQQKLAEQGNAQAVEDPAYWLPRHNMASVYFVGERPEVGWILGDYDPAFSGIPAGAKPTPEQIAAYLHDPDDDEHWEIDVIKMHLRTPQQKQWLEQHDLALQDIVGELSVPASLMPQIIQLFYQDWNAKLGEHVFGV